MRTTLVDHYDRKDEESMLAFVNGAVSAFGFVYNIFWSIVATVSEPIRYVLEKLNYITWIKKALLALLSIQFFTFLVAIIYYGAIVAATFDEQNTIMSVIFTSLSWLTGGVFVIATSIITPPKWASLVHDGRRSFMQKKYSLNSLLSIVLISMMILTIMQIVLIGFDPEFGFANDGEQDVVEGIPDQVFGSDSTISSSFDVDYDLDELPTDFEGDIVLEHMYMDLWQDRAISIYMLILCALGVHAMLTRAEIYLVSRRMQKIKRVTAVREYDPSGFARTLKSSSHTPQPRGTPGDIEMLVWIVAGVGFCVMYGLIVAMIPGDLYVMLGVFVSLAAAIAVGLFTSSLYTKSR